MAIMMTLSTQPHNLMRFRQGGFLQHPEDYVDETTAKPKKLILLMDDIIKLLQQLIESGPKPKSGIASSQEGVEF